MASKASEGVPSSKAHKMFMKGKRISEKAPHTFDGGMYLRSFEVDSLSDGMDASSTLIKMTGSAVTCEQRIVR